MQQLLQQPFGHLVVWVGVLCEFNILTLLKNWFVLFSFFPNYIHWNSIRTIVSLVLFFVHVTPLQSKNKH